MIPASAQDRHGGRREGGAGRPYIDANDEMKRAAVELVA
jgi:hypothetical protein